jgi:hypothetical protein
MAPVRPFDSTRDMIISAIFGRDKAGQTVKDLVIGVERFFTGKKVETAFSGGAAQKKPAPEPVDWSRLNTDHDARSYPKPATKTAVAGVDVDSMPAIAGMASFAMNRVAPDVVGDRAEGALHTEARATASSQPATSAPVTADDSWSFSMFAKQGTQPQQPATEDHQDASQEQVAIAPDSEDAPAHDAAQQPETADDEEYSQEQVALASDDEDASTNDDAAQQPATEDDAEASQAEVALASNDEDTRGDDHASQQPATDDDEHASLEEVAVASEAEAAPADDAAVMQTANAQAVTDPDDGFSFAAFPKPVTPADVVKEALPAEQLSHEDSSGSRAAESETAHPDVGSEDVGNAAPSKEPVVHHSDLAP